MRRAALLLVFLLVACGDVYVDAPRSVENAASVVRNDPSQTIPQDNFVSCQVSRPDENSPCDMVGATCEYGDSPDMSCNTTLACEGDVNAQNAAWTPRPSELCVLAQCPKGNVDSISGQPCDLPSVDGGAPRDQDELLCPMTDGTCACTTGADGAHAHARMWVCARPEEGCPGTRPLAGQPCGLQSYCDYGSCLFKHGLRMQCKDGVWITGGSPSCG